MQKKRQTKEGIPPKMYGIFRTLIDRQEIFPLSSLNTRTHHTLKVTKKKSPPVPILKNILNNNNETQNNNLRNTTNNNARY